jgi:hypothetical protein
MFKQAWRVLGPKGLRLAGLYLCAGMLLTVSVAWLIAWHAPLLDGHAVLITSEPPHRTILVSQDLGCRRAYLQGVYGDEQMDMIKMQAARDPTVHVRPKVPRWMSALRAYDANGAVELAIAVDAWGWPWPAMCYTTELDMASVAAVSGEPIVAELGLWEWRRMMGPGLAGPQLYHERGALALGGDGGNQGGGTSTHLLPVEPVWTGIVLNTLFYSCGCLAVHRLVSWTKVTWRRRLGQCATCGYPRLGLADHRCPECGGIEEHGKE